MDWPTREEIWNHTGLTSRLVDGSRLASNQTLIEVRRIRPEAFEQYYRRKYRNTVRKGMFFALREGLMSTLRKYRSKSIERRIEAAQQIIIAHWQTESCQYVAITRALGNAPLRFHPTLIFELPPDRTVDDVRLSPSARLLLEAYLPVPSCPVSGELLEAIVVANPFLLATNGKFVESEQRTTKGPAEIAAGAPRLRRRVPGVYLLGFGSYVREYILPHMSDHVVGALDYKAVLINEHVRPSFPVFESAEPLYDLIKQDPHPLVIICTYHSDHARMATEVLDRNPEALVFVEKPAAVELKDIEHLAQRRRGGAWIDVGYNRRYAPLLTTLRRSIDTLPRPLVLTFLVKEIKLAPTHWYFWPNQGTRITGNACHWIDLSCWLVGCPPVECSLQNSGDTVVMGMRFADDSLATILATDLGDDTPGVEETLDARAGDTTATLADFRTLNIRSPDRWQRFRRVYRDKGHARMYADLKDRWSKGGKPRYSADDLYWVGYLTAIFTDMFRTGSRHLVIPSHT